MKPPATAVAGDMHNIAQQAPALFEGAKALKTLTPSVAHQRAEVAPPDRAGPSGFLRMRLAGSRLEKSCFGGGRRRGMWSKMVVCVPADTQLRLEGIGETVQKAYGVGVIEEVVMTRLEGGPYKDAVKFSNGTEVLLQKLDRGLTAVIVASTEDLIDIADIAARPMVREYA